MAIIERSGNDGYDLTNALTWVGSVPTASDVAKWGSSANVGNTALISTSKQFGAVWISTSGTSTVNGGGSWGSSQITGAGVPNDRSLYIEANRILTGAANYAFLGGTAGAIRNHDVEILSGGELQVNGRIIGALSGTGYNGVTKYGAGTMWFGRSGTNMGTIGITSLTIREGTVKVGGAAGTDPIGTGTITFNATAGNTPTLAFEFYSTASRTISNAISVSNSGTIQANSGMTGTLTGGASGAGTLTIGAGGGTLNFNSNISCPLTVTGALTMGSSNNITGSTLSGAGTITMASGTITANAASFTGIVNGSFTYNGTGTMAGLITGTVDSNAGDVTFTNSNSSGSIGTLGYVIVRVNNAFFSGGSGGDITMNGAGVTSGPAMLRFSGAGGINSGRGFAANTGAHIILESAATVTSTRGVRDTVVSNNLSYVFADDMTTSTLNADFSQGSTTGSSTFVMAKTGGTLVVNGNFNQDSGAGGKTYSINGGTPWGATGPSSAPTSSPNANYKGVVRWTGTANTGCSLSVVQGTLHIYSSNATKVGNGLTVNANATLACSSTNAAYAAQITGNVSLAANSILRFGAPA